MKAIAHDGVLVVIAHTMLLYFCRYYANKLGVPTREIVVGEPSQVKIVMGILAITTEC